METSHTSNIGTISMHASDSIRVESFESFEQMSDLKQEWDELVESTHAGAFMCFDWQVTWWKYYSSKRELRIFIFRTDKEIVGVLPLFRECIQCGPVSLRVIKVVGSDFSPVTIGLPVHKDYVHLIAMHLLTGLEKDFQYELLYLGEISALLPNGKLLFEALDASKASSLNVTSKQGGFQTTFNVLENFDTQISTLGRRERKKLRRNRKAVDNKEVNIEISYADQDNFDQYFTEFVSLHQKSWQRRGRPGHFGAWPSSREFHEDVASRLLKEGRLWLQKITIGGKLIGLVYSFRMGDILCEYLDGRDLQFKHNKITFSRLSFLGQFDRARKNGIRYVDSMRGFYQYKLVQGGQLSPTLNIYVSQKTLGVMTKLLIMRLFFRLNHLLYYRLWRARISPRFGIRPKPLWSFWIKTYMLALKNPK